MSATRLPPHTCFEAAMVLACVLSACEGEDAEIDGADDTNDAADIGSRDFPSPMKVSETLAFANVTAGYHHTCALQSDGRAWCWGSNQYGQLGSSAPMQTCSGGNLACSPTPLQVDGALAFARLSGSIRHTCGLDVEHRAWCWGFGLGGQLGDGRREDSSVPVLVAGEHAFVDISGSLGGDATCALTSAGEAWCWGPNSLGQLGNATREASDHPQRIATTVAFKSISIGDRHACAVSTEGNAYCWGSNSFGILGGGENGAASNTPVLVEGGHVFASVAAGGEHTCALSNDGQAYCWGMGHLTGTEGAATRVSLPLAVETEHRFVAISAGFAHTCAMTLDGAIYCWGENLLGQLGDGTHLNRPRPARVDSPEIFASIAAGGAHTCALARDGFLWCWGGNPWGAVGQPVSDP
jgi:alpha-tubulin suppressor-like RCC1 family protein